MINFYMINKINKKKNNSFNKMKIYFKIKKNNKK